MEETISISTDEFFFHGFTLDGQRWNISVEMQGSITMLKHLFTVISVTLQGQIRVTYLRYLRPDFCLQIPTFILPYLVWDEK